jgi:DNA polymerase I-like protein with 3'-5' exonuclease and polymerase domains
MNKRKSKFNLLATTKNKELLGCFTAKEGEKIVAVDINALEPHVTAHFSQDPNYMRLYGPNSKPYQDIYILVGCNSPMFRDKFRKVYDPDNPTEEGLNFIKKNYDKDRQICKKVVLSTGYGAGAPKIQSELAVEGINLHVNECKVLIKSYWDTFKYVKLWDLKLQKEWETRGGYVINGRGMPIGIDKENVHKLMNKYVQSTGHWYLARMLFHISNIRKEFDIPAKPMIPDFHDATYWTCKEQDTEAVGFMLQESLKRLNNELQLSVVLKGKTKIGNTLAEVI